jgi:hypothetical protein
MPTFLPIFKPFEKREPLLANEKDDLKYRLSSTQDPDCYLRGLISFHIAEGFVELEDSLFPNQVKKMDRSRRVGIKAVQIGIELQANLNMHGEAWSSHALQPQMFAAALKDVELADLLPEVDRG